MAVPDGRLIVQRQGDVAELVINQPRKRNAISYEMWDALPGIIADLERDDAVKVLLVRGSGEHFSGGADISEFETRRADAASARRYGDRVERAERSLAGFAKPSIAAVQGFCLGGGCELAVACDLRFAARSALLGITPATLGIVYGFASTRHLVSLVGPSYAKYMLFSGARIGADEALRVGLVDQVFDDGDVGRAATELAETICSRSQISVRGAKTMVGKVVQGLTSADAEARDLPVRAVDSADYREGVRAFLEKRPPRFGMR